MFENSESLLAKRSMLAPPAGPVEGVRKILWNERELRGGWRLLIYIALTLVIVGVETTIALALRLPLASPTEITATGLLVQEIILMVGAVGSAAIMGLLEGRSLGVYGLPAARSSPKLFSQGVVWGLLMIGAMIALIRALGGFSFGEIALHGPMLVGYAALWGIVFLCVGIFEEFAFRGYAQFTLASKNGFWAAAAMLSAAFGALHLANGGEDKVGALSVFVIGMFFCLTLRRTGNLWFAVGLHASFDWGETFLFSVPNSGIVAPGHLLNSSFHGPAWLTGGTVGPEGSVIAFAVVAISAVIFSRIYDVRDEVRPEQ